MADTDPETGEVRCPYCGVFDGHNLVCITRQLTAAEARATRMEPERDRYDHALHSLTPGGSEFAHDAAACVAYVRRVRDSQMDSIRRFKSERDALQARVVELEREREEATDYLARLFNAYLCHLMPPSDPRPT